MSERNKKEKKPKNEMTQTYKNLVIIHFTLIETKCKYATLSLQ